MKIDLLGIVQINEATNSMEREVEFRRELHKLIASIFNDEEYFFTKSDELVERTNVKVEKRTGNIISKETDFRWNINPYKYSIKLTKSNIKKVQKYLDNEVYDDEDTY